MTLTRLVTAESTATDEPFILPDPDPDDRLNEALDNAHEAHRQDLATISEWLLAEAERRDWCADYDRLVREVNGRLSMPLTERKRLVDGEVIWTEYITVEVRRSESVYDWDQDEAEGLARRHVDGAGSLERRVRDLVTDLDDEDNVTDVTVSWSRDEGIRFEAN